MLQPTPERLSRSVFALGPATATEHGPATAGARVWRTVSPLDRLLRSGAIIPIQADAGNRLRRDYELGVAGARDRCAGSSATAGWLYPDAQLDALRRYQNAVRCLGPTLPVVLAVAVVENPIAAVAKSTGHNRQEVAGILKLGLNTLAKHYGVDERCTQR